MKGKSLIPLKFEREEIALFQTKKSSFQRSMFPFRSASENGMNIFLSNLIG